MKWFKIFALLVLLTIVISTSVNVARAEGPHSKCNALFPEVTNELTSPEFKVSIIGNQVKVSGRGLVKPEQGFRGVEWFVDLSKCMYRARRLPPVQIPSSRLMSPTVAGNWFAGIQVVTTDPFNIWEAESTNKLWWSSFANGSVQWTSKYKDCHPENPTRVNTHWFLESCAKANPYISGNIVFSAVDGAYYNWDFHDPNQKTRAEHYVRIEGHNDGSWSYPWWASHTGEDSGLLHGFTQFVGP